MNRRDFLSNCGSAVLVGALPQLRVGELRSWRAADFSLRIAPIQHELAPGKVIRTTAYNNSIPGPLLRMRQGEPVTVDVANDSDVDELVHWHGQFIPSDVDGAMEEGTPMIPAHGSRRYTFTPNPSGTRWYHSHAVAGHNLNRSTYTGQFGCIYIEGKGEKGGYDQEVFLALHDWNPYLSGGDDGFRMVMYNHSSINGRLLGHDDPIRVREGQRVMFRIVNASATDAHWLSLAGHSFTVVALDGNVVPTPKAVDTLRLGPGERIDAVVTMNAPGVWILGEPRKSVREAGLGIVVEYENRPGPAAWMSPSSLAWDYTAFGRAESVVDDASVTRVPLVFRSEFHGHGDFEHWTINGKSHPNADPILVSEGKRYRLTFQNESEDDHPVHLHRHSFELASVDGTRTAGVMKDVVIVPSHTTTEVLLTADNPGKSLFHCHQQDHMDAGFMTLLEYR